MNCFFNIRLHFSLSDFVQVFHLALSGDAISLS